MQDSNAYLKLELIWKDEEMIELNISASNGRYSGITQVYATEGFLYGLSQSIMGFPVNDVPIFYEIGEKGGYAYFSIKLYSIEKGGHLGAKIEMQANNYSSRSEGKDKVSLELLTEPNAIDVFQKALVTMAKYKEGKAILIGQDN